MFFLITIIVFFLCWGSFLNVVSYRVTNDIPFLTARSRCSKCKKTIAWYDNIPVISWLLLRGECRQCRHAISFLYPFIEIATAIIGTFLFIDIFCIDLTCSIIHIPLGSIIFFLSSFMFMSALICATRSDLESLVIPQLFSLWLVPVGIAFSYMNMTRVTVIESCIGAALGYGILWLVAYLFKRATGKEGLGEGDMELLAMIGSFLGPIGVWASLMIGSFSGLIVALIYLIATGKGRGAKIPYGPFLACGAVVYFFFYELFYTILNVY